MQSENTEASDRLLCPVTNESDIISGGLVGNTGAAAAALEQQWLQEILFFVVFLFFYFINPGSGGFFFKCRTTPLILQLLMTSIDIKIPCNIVISCVSYDLKIVLVFHFLSDFAAFYRKQINHTTPFPSLTTFS